MSARDLLIETIRGVGYDPILQGTMTENETYPDSFVTFFCDGSEERFFDDESVGTVWSFSVIFYTCDPSLFSTEPQRIRKALKAAGFIPQGKGTDILSDEPTHPGWANDYLFFET